MSRRGWVSASVLAVVLLSTSALAAWSAGPGPAPTQDLLEYSLLSYVISLSSVAEVSTSVGMERLGIQGSVHEGVHERVPVELTLRIQVSQLDRNDSATFRIASFVDVFFDSAPADPATRRPGFLTANTSLRIDPGDLAVGDLLIRPRLGLNQIFEVVDEAAWNNVRTFTTQTLYDQFVSATDPSGRSLFESAVATRETTVFTETREGMSAVIDSSFNISFRTASGGGTSQSFFDISYGVFEPNDEPVLEVAADGHLKVGAHLRPGQGDATLQVLNRQTERVDVVFNPKEYTLEKKTQWQGNRALATGESSVPVEPFFDVFVKVEPPPLNLPPVRKPGTLRVFLDFSPPRPGGAQPPVDVRVIAHEAVHTG